ncbi:MAG TPA: STAS domain-containing protein [Terriglobales bacterium]|nr:STAS domain-containing protein [Terriglobales bacterium]
MKLTIKIAANENDDVIVVHCQGRLVYRDEAAAVCAKVTGLMASNRLLVLDLSEVEAIDGSGVGQLVRLWGRAQSKGGMLKLVAPSAPVRKLLKLTRLDSIFETYPNLEEATLAFRGQPA